VFYQSLDRSMAEQLAVICRGIAALPLRHHKRSFGLARFPGPDSCGSRFVQSRLISPTLEDAIRKFTSLPAQRMRFADRGVLKAGMWADVLVFDPETVRDLATFDLPNQLSEGMRFVLVNGVPVIGEGKMTNALPGKVLTR
jgi:N-acyl-D-aspartate/D-glutamate deacylase